MIIFISFSIDLVLLLEYSFALVQNNTKDPFFQAVQIYDAFGTSTQVSKELKGLFVQYSAIKYKEERVKLIMDVISHHHYHLCE